MKKIRLKIEGLNVSIKGSGSKSSRILNDISLSIGQGEITGLVGESGSGKTMIGRTILRLLPPVASVESGTINFNDVDLLSVEEKDIRSLRGSEIGAVFQEPMTSLNPSMRIGTQMAEALMLHRKLSASEARKQCIRMLEKVSIRDPELCLNAYPHEFSGGMRQRIMLASVLALRPTLLIADEPTTALDALIRKEIMDLMVSLCREIGTAILLISHDLGMVAQYADNVTVLKQGEVVENGKGENILLNPQHSYTRDLMAAIPSGGNTEFVTTTRTPLIKIQNLSVHFKQRGGFIFGRKKILRAVDDLTLTIFKGEILAVVGESGSGKTTVGRTLMRLCQKQSGQIHFDGADMDDISGHSLTEMRHRMQMVFQDPYSSLDPRMTLRDIVSEGLRHVENMTHAEKLERASIVLEEVGLSRDYISRYPHELSGGQRQRVCIARAIISNPHFIVADEPVSALDVTVQRQVLELLKHLQEKYCFTYLFISHDLAVVENMADRVAVMYKGKLVEIGSRQAIYNTPHHPYTRRLLEATPRIVQRHDRKYELIELRVDDVMAPSSYDFFNPSNDDSQFRNSPHASMIEVAPGHMVYCAKK